MGIGDFDPKTPSKAGKEKTTAGHFAFGKSAFGKK